MNQPDVQSRSHSTDSLDSLRGERFACIYADPPWKYGNQATRGSTDRHYSTMTVDEICALPVGNLAADQAHLHLWTTNGFLCDAFRVIEAWGFEYRDAYCWVKPQMGLGNYWRVAAEYLLLGVRGNLPFMGHERQSWGLFRRRRHSEKPEAVRELVESVSPGPRLELFGPKSIAGWTVFGNQISEGIQGRLFGADSRTEGTV